MARLLAATGALLALVAAICLINLLRLPARTPEGTPPPLPAELDRAAAAQRLGEAVRIATVSYEKRADVSPQALREFAALLRARFPLVHAQLTVETVNGFSLLYTWAGSDPAAKPMLSLAHMDVVPVEPGTEASWTQPPFSGAVADGFVWGRGTLDDKGSLMAQLEAVEWLLRAGFEPRRTVYFAFGHDEEIGGEQGAQEIAALLAARGVKAEFSLDEGGLITRGVVAGVERPVASIMAAEKGYASFRLTARDAGGHSSRPPQHSAIGRLAGAVARLERRQFATQLRSPVTEMLERVAPEMPLGQRLAIANRWLFGPLLRKDMAAKPVTNALVRTTTAPTIFRAGIKDNVLPAEAGAVVNFRILPGESIATVESHIREVIDDDAIELKLDGFNSEPSPVSDTATGGYALLARVTAEVFPEAAITTGLVIGATDNRHYGAVREHRYNFLPVTLEADDLVRVHGANERIGVDAYARMIVFYEKLLRAAAGAP